MMKNKGFTLIETLIAITLITVVITAVAGLILTTLLSNQRNIHSLQAVYLAQESLEAMRYMRDSNWLQNYSWDGGQDLWATDISSADGLYLDDTLCNPSSGTYCYRFSRDEEDGQVEMDDGFTFTRGITVNAVTLDNETEEGTWEITASVAWEERGVPRKVELSTYLTNWQ